MFAQGLGAPIGSLLAGTKDFIERSASLNFVTVLHCEIYKIVKDIHFYFKC